MPLRPNTAVHAIPMPVLPFDDPIGDVDARGRPAGRHDSHAGRVHPVAGERVEPPGFRSRTIAL
jgi:hypothetical protein